MSRVRTKHSSLTMTFEGKPVNLTTTWLEVSEALAQKLRADAPLYVEFEAVKKPAPAPAAPAPPPQPKPSRPFGRSQEE